MFPQNKMCDTSSHINRKQHGDLKKGDYHRGIRQCSQHTEGIGRLSCTPLRTALSLVAMTVESGDKELVCRKGALLRWFPLLLADCSSMDIGSQRCPYSDP